MAKLDITSVNTSDTFQVWLNKTNELVELMNSEVLTASPVGDTTIGNATLTGVFTAIDLVSNTSIMNSLSTVSIVNKVDPVNFIAFDSPISVTSTQEKLLVLESSSQKPAINLINADGANWNVTLGTTTANSSFILETEGALNPQFILNQDGDLRLDGKLTADSIIAALTGNASTATKFAAPVNINGVAFDGSAAILINTNFALSRATTNSYLVGNSFNGSAAQAWSVDAVSANTANKVVVRDSAGDFSAGTITAALTGNAASATTLTGLTTTIEKLNYTSAVTSSIQGQLNTLDTNKAPIASPAFTGTPTAPTAPAGTSNLQVATTAFVDAAVDAGVAGANAPTKTGVGASGTWGINITGNAASATIAAGLSNRYTRSIAATANGGISLTSFASTVAGVGPDALQYQISMSGSYSGDFSVFGNITATSNVTAYSDERLKTNIRTVDNALDKVSNMRGVYFDKEGKASVGVIAQEMEKILPEVVFDGEYKSVAYGNIVGILIEAIKELKNEIELLKQNKST